MNKDIEAWLTYVMRASRESPSRTLLVSSIATYGMSVANNRNIQDTMNAFHHIEEIIRISHPHIYEYDGYLAKVRKDKINNVLSK